MQIKGVYDDGDDDCDDDCDDDGDEYTHTCTYVCPYRCILTNKADTRVCINTYI